METVLKEVVKTLDFPDKNFCFKSNILNMLKEVKEAMCKEQMEVMRRISYH